jgi:hypothetical protein
LCENCKRRFVTQHVAQHSEFGLDAFIAGKYDTLAAAGVALVKYFGNLYEVLQTSTGEASPFHNSRGRQR